ncbi:hypothetical protein BGZ98_008033 [Dissophora globulifera]|nr:hypothetical protein BGZ98_008033 [Dissophora globulifera]
MNNAEMDISLSISYEEQTELRDSMYRTIDQCIRLLVFSARSQDPDHVLLEMSIRNPKLLLQGVQFESHIPREPQQHLADLLDKAVNADIRLSFCTPTMPGSHRQPTLADNSITGSLGGPNERILQVHSCILQAADTVPLQRLLNTFPHIGHSIGAGIQLSTDVNNILTALAATEPIREIRFEDSSPAAVEAVIRYLYLGQPPALEPGCGYTVKDLMALAVYLEIEELQDICVDLVLGRTQDHHERINDSMTASMPVRCPSRFAQGNRCGKSDDHTRHYSISRRAGLHPYRRCQAQLAQGTTAMTGRQCGQSKAQIASAHAARVLFGWGWRFTKMRSALIEALVQGGRGGEETALEGFQDHEEFSALLHDMVVRGAQ